MVTKVMERNTETLWYVEPHSHQEKQEDGTTKYVFDSRPELVGDVRELEPSECYSYDGAPQHVYNKVVIGNKEFHVIKTVFHADLGEWWQYIDKITSNTDVNKEEAERKQATLLRSYNKQKIEADERMRDYCELHHLKPADTDADKLAKILGGTVVVKECPLSSEQLVRTSTVWANPYISGGVTVSTGTASANTISCGTVTTSTGVWI